MTTVGIIGAGQLGQMLGQAGKSLGIDCVFLDPSTNPPAEIVGQVINRPFDDLAAIRELAACADILTYEFENIPVSVFETIADEIAIYPPPAALKFAQDRLIEKQLLESLGIPVARFQSVDSEADLINAAKDIGLPLVLKTRRLGYDGKGQVVIRNSESLRTAWQRLTGVPLIAEQMIDFDYEVSAIGARGLDGTIVNYPLTRNEHNDGILRTSRSTAGNTRLDQCAETYHSKLVDHLAYVGILALELFVVGDQLLANEFAPRVHNSGHWTIEGSVTSQFENHLRAVTQLPLGDTSSVGFAAMENVIGAMPSDLQALRERGFRLHDYNKAERPARKIGHITVVADDEYSREQKLSELHRFLAN